MNSIISRVSYLNGLIEGLGITNETKEGKAITELANILKDMAIEVKDLQIAQEEIEDYIDAIDDDLCDVEDEIFENDDENDDKNDEDEDECCDVHVEYPHCNQTVSLDTNIFNEKEKITCPSCHEPIVLDCNCSDCDD